jgi:multidrug efflux pump subunit AcrA (membrane-fusion protein)
MSLFRRRYSPRFDASLLQQEENQMIWQKYSVLAIVTLVSGTLYWVNRTHLDEVTVAQGQVLPFEEVFRVQHPKGGRISHVLVKEGDLVDEEQTLAVLDKTMLEDERGSLTLQLETARKRKRYFDEQYQTRKQLTQEGLNSKLAFLNMKMSREELKGQIKDLQYRIQQVERYLLDNEIRAPRRGWIYNLKIMPNQVLQAGQSFCEIVPETSKLMAEVQIPAKEIGHIQLNQNVLLKIHSYDYARYGGIHSTLVSIAPISSQASSGDLFYRGHAVIPGRLLESPLGQQPILPGMSIEAEIKTGTKTLAEYLLKPIVSSAREAMRER